LPDEKTDRLLLWTALSEILLIYDSYTLLWCAKLSSFYFWASIDTLTGQTVRLTPRRNVRELAWAYAPSARNKWEAQLIGYQHIPDELLLQRQSVELTVSVNQIVGQAGRRESCEICGEEIINQRELIREGTILCKSCTGKSYFRFIETASSAQM
jgi:hypothetical protein